MDRTLPALIATGSIRLTEVCCPFWLTFWRGSLIFIIGLSLGIRAARAQDATWDPGEDGDWNNDNNWDFFVPGSSAIATFDNTADITAVTVSAATSVGSFHFSNGAPAFSFAINAQFNITGIGILNNSSQLPTFTIGAGGRLNFQSTNATSSAGNAVIINNAGGLTQFFGASTAGTASITNNGGTLGTGSTLFQGTSTASTSTITTNSTGFVTFTGSSTGGQARFITNTGGFFDISGLTDGGMTAGSIEGAGNYRLGANVLTVGNALSTTVSGNIVDAGSTPGTGGGLTKVGSSTLTLSGVNTYTGATTVSVGTLQAGSSTGFSSTSAFTVTSTLNLNGFANSVASLAGGGNVTNSSATSATLTAGGNGTNTTFSGTLTNGTGTLGLTKTGAGTMTLSGTNAYTGATTVSAGVLQVDGVLGSTAVTVQSAATLSGQGTIAGTVTIADGGHLAPGPGAQTLSTGNLLLSSGSILDYVLSTPGAIGSGKNTLVNVGGNLTLAGVLNVTNGGRFGSGSYRLLNYSGDLTDNGLTLGSLPAGFSASNVTVTTGVPGQVNLVVSSLSSPTQFWNGPQTTFDGTIHGGTGTWDNFTTNFTDAAVTESQSWQNGVAIFAANPGTVTLGANIIFQGMQFESDGYAIVGAGAFELDPQGIATISTDPGVGATISAPINGLGGLNKAGLGLLILTGTNSYSGGTTVSGGVLSVASDANLGDVSGGIILSGGELLTSVDGFSSGRAIDLSPSGTDTLAAAAGTSATYSGTLTDSGGLVIGDPANTGTVILTGTNLYSGDTTVSAGTLQIGNPSTTGSIVGAVVNSGIFSLFNANTAGITTITNNSGGITNFLNANTASTTGITNNSGGTTNFLSASTAGAATITNNANGLTVFHDTSSAANATFTTSLAGETDFNDSSTAGNAIINSAGLTAFHSTSMAGTATITTSVGGVLAFRDSSTAENSTLTNNGGEIDFREISTAGAASITNNTGGHTYFIDTSTGAQARMINNAGGFVDISGLTSDGTTAGSIEGAGTYSLGSKTFTVGSSNLSTEVSGTIQDGGLSGGSGGALIKIGTGTLILSGADTYTGGTTVSAGTLQVGNGGNTGSILGDVLDNAALVVNRTGTIALTGAVTGTGTLSQVGPGTLVLSGTSTYSGATTISAGTLEVDGVLGNSAVTVQSGATLSGNGTITPSVTIEDGGTLAPGPGAQTLNVGSLTLNQNSILNYQLSTAGVVGSGVNTLVNVTGNLTLDGTLNVGNGGNFGGGAYRLLNYTGLLNDQTLEIGTLPSGFTAAITTGVLGQVTLVVSSLSTITQFWDGSNTAFDGTVHGGSGTWDTFTTNFIDDEVTVNQTWQNGVAIFGAAPGTVTLGDDIAFQGIQFTSDGYTIQGAGAFTLAPTGTALVSTDNGVTATISAAVTGTGGLNKAGGGTLILAGANTYTGGTVVSGGILSIAVDGNLGNPTGSVELNGGELLTTASLTSGRAVTLSPSLNGANTLAAAVGTAAVYTGIVAGSGGLTIGDPGNAGTVVLANANNSYTGGTTISGGTLSVARDSNLGDAGGGITLDGGELLGTGNELSTLRPIALTANGGTLAAAAAGGADLEGDITGSGGLTIGDAVNSGTVELGGTNTYLGSTTVVSGATLQVRSTTALSPNSAFIVIGTLDLSGFSPEIGSLTGSGTITDGDDEPVVLTAGGNNASTTFSGVLEDGTHPLSLTKTGTGTLILTGANTYSNGTTISAGALQVGNGGTTGSITGDVLDNAQLVFNRLDNITFAGNISGAGGLTQAGPGTLVLTGTNSYSGGTTIVGATLQIGNGLLSGSIVGDVTDNGALVFYRADGVTFSGIISGAGGLTQSGGSPLILTGANTYTGGTTITAGTALDIGDGGTTGSIVGSVTDNGSLVFNRSDDLTFSGVVSGPGTLIQEGSGTLTLTGANNYNGGTIVAGGTLSVASDAQLGAPGGAITLEGGELLTTGESGFVTARSVLLIDAKDSDTLAAVDDTEATYTGVVSDGGNGVGLVVGDSTNQGTVVLTGVNIYSGGTIVAGGRLSVASDVNLGALNGGLILSGGALETTADFTTARTVSVLPALGRSSLFADFGTTATYTGIISGPGLLSVDGPGTVVLSGTNTYAGGTLTQNGVLSVATDANLGDPAGAIILEAGELLTTGASFLSARPVAVNPGQGADTLAAATATKATYTGIFSGNGTLVIGDSANGGTVVLGGLNTYSGGTVINVGTLLVDSAQALGTGDVTVNGGVLAADPQPINVLGNYTQNAAGTLQLSVAGANPGQYDTLNVSGNALLDGTLQLISLGFQPVAGNQLGLVTTGGLVSGRFAHFVDPFVAGPRFNTIDLVYGRNSVVLKFLNTTSPISPVVPIVPSTPATPTTPGLPPVVISTMDFVSFALSPNQGSSATLVNQVELDPRAAGLVGFLLKESPANLPSDFEKISPDGLGSFYEIGFSGSNIQRLNLEDRLDEVRNGSSGFNSNMKVNGANVPLQDEIGPDGKASKSVVEPVLQPGPENRWGVWVSGFGDFVSVDSDANAKGYNFTTGGVSLGLDFRLTDQLVIGAMGDYAHTWTSLQPSGHIDVDSGRGGLYATWFDHGAYLNGAIYGGHNNYDSGRAGLGGLANGGTEGAEWSTFLSGGYDFHLARLTVGPIAALQYTEVGIDEFSEKGSLAAMQIHSGSAESLRSDVGFRAFYQWQIGKVIVQPSLKAAWEHEYKYSALPITAGFAGIPGPSSTFFGPSEGHDSAVVSAGVSVLFTPTISTYLNYDGQLGRGNYDSNAVTGGLRVTF